MTGLCGGKRTNMGSLNSLAGLIIFCCFILSIPRIVSDDESAIKQLLYEQQEAWNRGDIESFMEAYWDSEELKFYGTNGLTKGWKATKENYYKRYPNRQKMGHLTFGIKSLDRISDNSYFLLGTYSLKRQHDNPSGAFTLIWKKIEGDWKIIADMTCASQL